MTLEIGVLQWMDRGGKARKRLCFLSRSGGSNGKNFALKLETNP